MLTEERKHRAAPNPNRPRLPEEDESKLKPLDELTARAYTALEDGLDAIRELFGEGAPVPMAVTDTGVVKLDKAAREKIERG